MTFIADVFQNYRLRETCLDQCLKSCVSQDPSTDNMANGSEHFCNQNDSTFTKSINHCKDRFIGKTLF